MEKKKHAPGDEGKGTRERMHLEKEAIGCKKENAHGGNCACGRRGTWIRKMPLCEKRHMWKRMHLVENKAPVGKAHGEEKGKAP